jgi:hypothetical protein
MTLQHARWSSVQRMTAAVVGLVCATVALSGCSLLPGAAQAPESAVAQKFFDLLISGKTSGIKELLSSGATVPDEALDPDLYRKASARPVSAEVRKPEVVDGKTRVRVDYRVSGSDAQRQLVLEMTEDGGTPKVSGWVDMALTAGSMLKPGALAVAGTRASFALPSESTTDIVLLPGTYRLDYADPSGVGTTADTGSGDGSGVLVTFPGAAGAEEAAPAGFQWAGGALVVRPRMKDEAKATIDDAAQACGASGLIGPTCPADLVAHVRGRGQTVDPATVRWASKGEPDVVAPYTQWTVSAAYTLTYATTSGSPTTLDTVTFPGTVSRGADGGFVFTPKS